jgi:hypothetical protein
MREPDVTNSGVLSENFLDEKFRVFWRKKIEVAEWLAGTDELDT